MRPKEKPIIPGNEINQRLWKAIQDKQGDQTLYEICKKFELFAGTFRRTIEGKHSWVQAKLLFDLSKYLGKSYEYFLTGRSTPIDTIKETNTEIQFWKKKSESFEKLYKDAEVRLKAVRKSLEP